MKKTILLYLMISTAIFASQTKQEALNIGQKVSKELLVKLSSNLKHKLKTEGLIAAAAFCNENALTLTEEVNLKQLKGINVKRISLKVRNPANTPSSDEIKVLKSMQTMLNEKRLPKYIIQEKNENYKYYKPLVIKKDVCLKCHGNIDKNPKLSTFMKEHYPQDKATGYKTGELRGAIVVEINN